MLHRHPTKPDSKCNWVMDSLAKGWRPGGKHVNVDRLSAQRMAPEELMPTPKVDKSRVHLCRPREGSRLEAVYKRVKQRVQDSKAGAVAREVEADRQ